jgi:hypothetical protein
MSWEPWNRDERLRLAQYVTAAAGATIDLGLDRMAAEREPNGRIKIATAIYDALKAKRIRYTLEGYHPSEAKQTIRPPSEIYSAREGTCLDLALLFCGVCLRFELLPFLIVIEGHALAAVSVTHGLRDWNGATRPGRSLFEHPVTEVTELRSLIDERRAVVAVECTGFATSGYLSSNPASPYPETIGREAGTMPFLRGVAAGREQLNGSRPFQYALDIAVIRYMSRIEPLPDDAAGKEPTEIPGLRFQAWCPNTMEPEMADVAEERVPDYVDQDLRAALQDLQRLRALADRFAGEGRSSPALKAYQSLAAEARKTGDLELYFKALESMGQVYWSAGDRARACSRWRARWNACRTDAERLRFESSLRGFIDGTRS